MQLEKLVGKQYTHGSYFIVYTHRSRSRGTRCYVWRSDLVRGWHFRVEFRGVREVGGSRFRTRHEAANAALWIAESL